MSSVEFNRYSAAHDGSGDVTPQPTDANSIFARLNSLAARMLDAPWAALVTENQTLFLTAGAPAQMGAWLAAPSTPREASSIPGDDDPGGGDPLQTLADVGFQASAPLVDPDGQTIGLLRVGDFHPHAPLTSEQRQSLTDIAALAAATIQGQVEFHRLREQSARERERTEIAMGAVGMGAFDWDLEADRVIFNDRSRRLIGIAGRPAQDWSGKEFLAWVHPDDRQELRECLSADLQRLAAYRHEFRVVRPIDARTVWIDSASAPIASTDGVPTHIVGVLQDITARKLDEQQRETLVAELDHRIKNVLASVQSLAAQSARRASSMESFLKTFGGRLKSMASAHQLLTATRWRGAGMQNIAAAELGGLAPGHIRWEGPDLLLTPRATNAMSLALHELATNAVKFGALSVETGRVEVTWRVLDEGGIRLTWQESSGPRTGTPSRRGFGLTLLDKVTGRELGGEARIDFLNDGVRAVITAGPSAFAELEQPAQPEPEAAEPAPTIVGASAGKPTAKVAQVKGMRVLIVEDAVLLALELEAGLQEAGLVVVGCAADLGEAMNMIEQPLDAAVLDVNLNGVSVLPVAAALAQRGVPFVFATGYGDNKQGPQGYDAPVIRKPYDVTQVAVALAEATGRG